MKLKHNTTMFIYLALVSSLLFAVDKNEPPLTGTFIPQGQSSPKNTIENNHQDQYL